MWMILAVTRCVCITIAAYDFGPNDMLHRCIFPLFSDLFSFFASAM